MFFNAMNSKGFGHTLKYILQREALAMPCTGSQQEIFLISECHYFIHVMLNKVSNHLLTS